jgi:hypothetical protein
MMGVFERVVPDRDTWIYRWRGSSLSRIGSAIGPYLVPLSFSGLGIGLTMIVGGAFILLGALVSVAWATETRGLTLVEAAALPGMKGENQSTHPRRLRSGVGHITIGFDRW